jgi:hypothetical protein
MATTLASARWASERRRPAKMREQRPSFQALSNTKAPRRMAGDSP